MRTDSTEGGGKVGRAKLDLKNIIIRECNKNLQKSVFLTIIGLATLRLISVGRDMPMCQKSNANCISCVIFTLQLAES